MNKKIIHVNFRKNGQEEWIPTFEIRSSENELTVSNIKLYGFDRIIEELISLSVEFDDHAKAQMETAVKSMVAEFKWPFGFLSDHHSAVQRQLRIIHALAVGIADGIAFLNYECVRTGTVISDPMINVSRKSILRILDQYEIEMLPYFVLRGFIRLLEKTIAAIFSYSLLVAKNQSLDLEGYYLLVAERMNAALKFIGPYALGFIDEPEAVNNKADKFKKWEHHDWCIDILSRKGIDLSPFMFFGEFTSEQLVCIAKGIEEGLDVRLYLDPSLSIEKMGLIKTQLLSDLESGVIDNPFTEEFMDNIKELSIASIALIFHAYRSGVQSDLESIENILNNEKAEIMKMDKILKQSVKKEKLMNYIPSMRDVAYRFRKMCRKHLSKPDLKWRCKDQIEKFDRLSGYEDVSPSFMVFYSTVLEQILNQEKDIALILYDFNKLSSVLFSDPESISPELQKAIIRNLDYGVDAIIETMYPGITPGKFEYIIKHHDNRHVFMEIKMISMYPGVTDEILAVISSSMLIGIDVMDVKFIKYHRSEMGAAQLLNVILMHKISTSMIAPGIAEKMRAYLTVDASKILNLFLFIQEKKIEPDIFKDEERFDAFMANWPQ